MPKISVLMPAYNCAAHVDEAVESILIQTFSDFELLIVDDASTDNTWDKLQTLAAHDQRIRLLRNNHNAGIANALNRLVPESAGQYIARMDADDVAEPTRFERQVAVLDSGGADLCGTWVTLFDGDSEVLSSAPVNDEEIRTGLLFAPMFTHPTIMLRRELLERHLYDPKAEPAEDYDQWVRMAPDARMYNIPESLLRYRAHAAQISVHSNKKQWDSVASISMKCLARSGIVCTDVERNTHISISNPQAPTTTKELHNADLWLQKLVIFFDGRPASQRIIARMWYRYCLKAAPRGLPVFWHFLRSSVSKCDSFKLWQYLAVLGLCLLRVRHKSKLYHRLQLHSPVSRVRP